MRAKIGAATRALMADPIERARRMAGLPKAWAARRGKDCWPPGMTAAMAELAMQRDPVLSCGRLAEMLSERFGVAVTANAVIGKRHRLGLANRPSPIRRREAA